MGPAKMGCDNGHMALICGSVYSRVQLIQSWRSVRGSEHECSVPYPIVNHQTPIFFRAPHLFNVRLKGSHNRLESTMLDQCSDYLPIPDSDYG